MDAGDYVVVSDALQVRLTGKKAEDKLYYHHTGFVGGLKAVPITRMRERRPEEVCPFPIYHALLDSMSLFSHSLYSYPAHQRLSVESFEVKLI